MSAIALESCSSASCPSSRGPASFALLLLLALAAAPAPTGSVIQLPNTTGIDGQLTENLGVDKFFSLWIVFNNDDVQMSEKPFTILAPRNNASLQISPDKLSSHPEMVKKLLLDHVVLGQRLDLDLRADLSFTTLGGRTVQVRRKKGDANEGALFANGARVANTKVDVNNDTGRLIIIENYLFSEDFSEDHSFLQDMTEVLSFLQSGVRVFQHLLARSNVTKLLNQDETYTVFVPTDLNQDETYTVFVPTDRAFQRWHPIDWGFYPFSVPEFTESVLMNHFVKDNIHQDQIKDEQKFKTLGGKEVIFQRKGSGLTVNGVEVIKGDTPIEKGNIMFISEVLFVNDGVVQRLHEKHKDKETPPLLAFPWFGAQFLSHAYMSIEHHPNFTHIVRFLNVAELAPHVPGAGYTFFVPLDEAFERQGLKYAPDNYLSTTAGIDLLLSHFVKGRLYEKDLQNNATFTTLANNTLTVHRENGQLKIENATVVKSEVFVYNLGTMFYIDQVLYRHLLPEKEFKPTPSTSTSAATMVTTLPPDVEIIDQETTTDSELGTETAYPDLLLEEDTTKKVVSNQA
nr:PREDICTED: transforming growth factor-beta-induced protein ig-h3 [Bemisia tabaci]